MLNLSNAKALTPPTKEILLDMCLQAKDDPRKLKKMLAALDTGRYHSVGASRYAEWHLRVHELVEFIRDNQIQLPED